MLCSNIFKYNKIGKYLCLYKLFVKDYYTCIYVANYYLPVIYFTFYKTIQCNYTIKKDNNQLNKLSRTVKNI